ncbi:MAG: hypothetical protein WB217_05945, partial [Mesobacillus sp.]|uniref:hypothetical protein n=1 Tax=Mesobacillus sp. TaxID=2675271 RepID=UPI003C541977
MENACQFNGRFYFFEKIGANFTSRIVQLQRLALRRTGRPSADVAAGRGGFSRPALVELTQDGLASTLPQDATVLVDVHFTRRLRFSNIHCFPLII